VAKSILFVDDEFSPDTRTHYGSYMSYYKEALIEAGFDVTCVRSTDEAIASAGLGRFDLAILDVMMPPGEVFRNEDTRKGLMTGPLLARSLHKFDPAMPIMFLSNAGGNQELFATSIDRAVVREILFKLDVTPLDLVEKVRLYFTEGNDVAI
jgi:CheY-like chemotaxis protein